MDKKVLSPRMQPVCSFCAVQKGQDDGRTLLILRMGIPVRPRTTNGHDDLPVGMP